MLGSDRAVSPLVLNARPCALRGFTLTELLVVMGVIALLAGMLLPVLGRARAHSGMAVCLGQVRQIGVALHGHANDHGDRLPVCARLGPLPAYGLPSLSEVLRASLDNAAEVFHCPSDIGASGLFVEFGTSYEWNTFVNGRLIDRANFRVVGLDVSAPLLGDGDAFHPGGLRSYLYADGHVATALDILIR